MTDRMQVYLNRFNIRLCSLARCQGEGRRPWPGKVWGEPFYTILNVPEMNYLQ